MEFSLMLTIVQTPKPSGHQMQTVVQYTNCQLHGKRLDTAMVEWIQLHTSHYQHSTEHGRLEMNGQVMMSTYSCLSTLILQEIVTMQIGQRIQGK